MQVLDNELLGARVTQAKAGRRLTLIVGRRTLRKWETGSMEEVNYNSRIPAMPTQVKIAAVLLCVSLVVGAVDFVLGSPQHETQLPIASIAATAASPLILVALLYIVAMIAKRKNWARIVLLALFAIQLPFAVPSTLQGFASSFFAGFAAIAHITLRAITIVLLFQGQSNAWFGRSEIAPAREEPLPSRKRARFPSLCSVTTGLLAWTVFFLAIYLIQTVPKSKVGLGFWPRMLWLEFVIPGLLAIIACLSGIVAATRHWNTSRSGCVLSVIGTALGGGFLFVLCGLLYLGFSLDL